MLQWPGRPSRVCTHGIAIAPPARRRAPGRVGRRGVPPACLTAVGPSCPGRPGRLVLPDDFSPRNEPVEPPDEAGPGGDDGCGRNQATAGSTQPARSSTTLTVSTLGSASDRRDDQQPGGKQHRDAHQPGRPVAPTCMDQRYRAPCPRAQLSVAGGFVRRSPRRGSRPGTGAARSRARSDTRPARQRHRPG